MQLWAVRRATDDFEREGVRERARRRRGTIRDKVTDLIDRSAAAEADDADNEPE